MWENCFDPVGQGCKLVFRVLGFVFREPSENWCAVLEECCCCFFFVFSRSVWSGSDPKTCFWCQYQRAAY